MFDTLYIREWSSTDVIKKTLKKHKGRADVVVELICSFFNENFINIKLIDFLSKLLGVVQSVNDNQQCF
jgi:hypothetical protein